MSKIKLDVTDFRSANIVASLSFKHHARQIMKLSKQDFVLLVLHFHYIFDLKV
jgi:hypothetical protein